jgi:hypothetical protein
MIYFLNRKENIMALRCMTTDEVDRMMGLASSPYRPPQIRILKEQIEGETKALELRESITGDINEEDVQRVVDMRLELDRLYTLWTLGQLQ